MGAGMITDDLDDYAEAYYKTTGQSNYVLKCHDNSLHMPALESMRGYERTSCDSSDMFDLLYSSYKKPVLNNIESASTTPQYFYREATPTQKTLYFPETRRSPSPEPLSEVCCGKENSLLSMLIRCFLPCLSSKNDS